jgi:hypothetical protein
MPLRLPFSFLGCPLPSWKNSLPHSSVLKRVHRLLESYVTSTRERLVELRFAVSIRVPPLASARPLWTLKRKARRILPTGLTSPSRWSGEIY